MRKFIGDGSQTVPGVPARDLTEEEWRYWVQAGRIVEGHPSSKLWKKESERSRSRDGEQD